jgi:signal transduction histidine kinase
MSASPHSFLNPPQPPDVLGELLHSLSQPLTSLRCSLELSIDEEAEQRQESVVVALQQTEKVIGMVQLMREYLEAEHLLPATYSSALTPVLRSVVEELASIAAEEGIKLQLVGTCKAPLAVSEPRLRLALQYLIAAIIETQAAGGKVTLRLGEGPAGTVLRAESELGFRKLLGATPTLRRVRLAIACRMLESAGASLAFDGKNADPSGFVLRIPRRV